MLVGASGLGCTDNPGDTCFPNPKSILSIILILEGLPYNILSPVSHQCPSVSSHLFPLIPRIQVVLMDQSRPVPTYLDRWHLFLPSEVSLACTTHVLPFPCCSYKDLHRTRLLWSLFFWHVACFRSRIVHLYVFILPCLDGSGSIRCTAMMWTCFVTAGLGHLGCLG